MPDYQSQAAALRADGHKLRAFVSFYVGDVAAVFNVNVGYSAGEYPLTAISGTYSTGSASDVGEGFLVEIRTSGGALRGVTRTRYGATQTATSLKIRELSRGEIVVANGDVITIRREVRLSDRLVTATDSFDPDGIPVGTFNLNPPPIANSGGLDVGFVDAGQTFRTVQCFGSLSRTVDPASSGTMTHSWTIPSGGGGFQSGSSSTDADPVMELNVGRWLIRHVVTDSTNGKATTQYIMMIVHDDTSFPPYECLLEPMEGSKEDGWSYRVRVFEDADEDAIPYGSYAVVWVDERINGTAQSFGSPVTGRSHIKAVGILRREETREDDTGADSLTFEVISPLAHLGQLAGFSKVMIREASPDAWAEINTLKTQRGITQLWQFYCNAGNAGFDLIIDPDAKNYDYPILFLQKDSPLGQIRELADGTQNRFVCDRRGRFELQPVLNLMTRGARNTRATALVFSRDDIVDIRVSQEHWRPTETFRLKGFAAHSTSPYPVFARWPGAAPGQGNQSGAVERVICAHTEDAYFLCGLYGAMEDGWFVDADLVGQFAPRVTITTPGSYDLLDFYGEWIEFDFALRLRGLDLSKYRYELIRSSVTYESGTAQCVFELQGETFGEPGVDDTPPASVTDGLTDWSLIWNPISFETFVPTGDWDGNNQLPVKMWGISYTNPISVARSTSFNPATHAVTYEDLGDMGGVITGLGMWGCSDPHNYFRKFILTTTGLWKIEDLWVGSPVATLVASNATMFGASNIIGHKVAMTHNDKKGWIMVLTGASSLAVSFDYGATWTQREMTGGTFAGGTSGTPTTVCDAVICGWNSSSEGWIYGTFGNSFGSNVRMCRSTNWGLNWTVLWQGNPAGTIANVGRLHVPYLRQDGSENRNDADLEIFAQWGISNNSIFEFSDSAGVSQVSFSHLQSSNAAGFAPYASAPAPRRNFAFTHDATRVWSVGISSGSLYFTVSDDGMNTILRSGVISAGGAIASINGFSVHRDFAVVFAPGDTAYGTGAGTVHYTDDGGQNWYNIVPSFFGNARCAYFEGDLSDFIPQRG